MTMPFKVKDPQATLDYTFDWSDWLGTDTLSASTWSVSPTGLTITSPAASFTTTEATVWASGGTAGTQYTVTNHITTAAGRIEDRSMDLLIEDE